MSDTIKNKVKLGVMVESTEGTWLTPSGVTKFLAVNDVSIVPIQELLEREVITGHIGKITPVTGMRSVTASVTSELKTSGVAGQEPQVGPLIHAALGAKRSTSATITTKASGNTATVLQIEDADIASLNVGDIVVIKQAGAFVCTPIVSKTTGTGTATVTVLIAHPSGDYSDSVVIEKIVTFYTANEGHPTISLSKYSEDALLEKGMGLRVSSFGIANWVSGQIANFTFELEGLDFGRELVAPSYVPSFDNSIPASIQCSYVYINGVAEAVPEVSWTVENTVAFKTSTQSCSGRESSRISARSVTGSIAPYRKSDDLSIFQKFVNSTEFGLFGYSANPTGVEGEYKEYVAWYLPKCLITEIGESDIDGLMQDSVSFMATRGATGSTEELYLGFI